MLMLDWELARDGLVCVTFDSGANMVKAMQTAGWQLPACFGHNLHNAVNNGLASDENIARAISKCRAVCRTIVHRLSFDLQHKHHA